ncbi:MAG TPA: hypothetical protein RMH80_30870 [Polyangiaceae bacterium LLY-WYZ-15_(1-7)]|nr:hypothetical protein [Polyangiaceae bacterium LLY-WYZ-15_(1-7)]
MADASSDSAPRGRVRGRFVAFGLLLLIGSLVTFALSMWFANREPDGPLMAVAPSGAGVAYTLRRGFEERGYVHLVREREDGAQDWSEALFGVAEEPGLVADEGGVYLLAREARGYAEGHAFAPDGPFRWRGGRGTYETPDENPEGLPPFGPRPLRLGEDELFVLLGGEPVEVIALALEDGEERARVELPTGDAPRGAAVVAGTLWIAPGDGGLYRLEAGEAERVASTDHGWCATGRAVYAGDARGFRLWTDGGVATHGDGAPIHLLGCGRDGGDDLLAIRTPAGELALQRVRDHAPVGGRPLPVAEASLPAARPFGFDGLLPTAEGLFDGRGVRVAAGAFDAALALAGGHVSRDGARLWRVGSDEAVSLPGLRGAASDGAKVWAWTEAALLALDPETLRPVSDAAAVMPAPVAPPEAAPAEAAE